MRRLTSVGLILLFLAFDVLVVYGVLHLTGLFHPWCCWLPGSLLILYVLVQVMMFYAAHPRE